jgi:hypothetical protein
MKNIKFLLFALTIIVLLLPIKTFGFFATPDKYVHSMPFGVQTENLTEQKIPILLNSGQNNNIVPDNNGALENLITQNENRNAGVENNKYLFENISWIIFIFAVVIVVISFILLKFKKVI